MSQGEISRPLLTVRRLRVHYRLGGVLRRRQTVRAIDDLHFDLRPGETLAIVGEAGSGKSTLLAALTGSVPATAGSIAWQGQERVGLSPKVLYRQAAGIQRLAQSPLSQARKRVRVEKLLRDTGVVDGPRKSTAVERRGMAGAALLAVGLSADVAEQRLGQLDPAARARVLLLIALASSPRLLLLDGPVEGLDAAARSEFLALVLEHQRGRGFALIVTAREFGDVENLPGRVLVLSVGRTLEQGPTAALARTPVHPYSRRLLALASGLPLEERTEEGELLSTRATPSAANPPMGCVFHTRCSLVERACVQSVPLLKRTTAVDHYVACHFAPVP